MQHLAPFLFRLASLTILLVVPSLLTAQEAKKGKRKDSATASRIQRKTYDFKDAGKEMEYALFVPTKYEKEKKTPLIVALHGLYSNPQQILRYPKFTELAEEHGFILAAPMGYNSSGWYGSKAIRNAKLANLAELSEKDVMNVLEIVRKEFNVDEDRIYLMGHSMGGGGTWHLALKYPKIWAAVAPIAPAIFRGTNELEKMKFIPVLVIQGDKDNLVPVAGARRWVDAMKKLEMTHEYIEVKGGGHVDVAFQNLPRMFEFFEKHRKKSN